MLRWWCRRHESVRHNQAKTRVAIGRKTEAPAPNKKGSICRWLNNARIYTHGVREGCGVIRWRCKMRPLKHATVQLKR